MSSTSHQTTKLSSSLSHTSLSSLESISANRSISSDTIPTIAKTARGSVRYKWSSNWEIIALQLASFITVESFFIMPINLFAKQPSTILNYFFFYLAIGIPVVYMQVVVGQYSQLGVLFFKYLTPIGHGIGFLMCINTFWGCINQGVNMGDVSLYFLSAMETELPWMQCPKDNKKCWVFNPTCRKDCLTPEKNLSAFVFWSEVYMENIDLEATSLKYTAPILARVVVVGVGWAIVYFLTRMRISKYRKVVLVNLYIAAVLFTLLVLVCILEQGGSTGLELFSNTDWSKLFYAEAWTSVVVGGVRLLGLGRACYVVYGSYMDFKTPSNILTIASVCFNFFWVFFGCVLIFAGMGIIADKSKTPVGKLKHMLFAPMPQFIVLPQALGYLGAPQLWTTIYFLLSFLLLINHQVTQVEIVERCITDLNYRFKHYSDYILGALCLIGVLSGVLLVSKDSFTVHSLLTAYVVLPVKVFTVAIMCTLICWVYGVQHFSDDIHFMIGAQPAKYWKILWYTIPVALWLGTIHAVNHLKTPAFLAVPFIFGATYICPLPIMAVIAIFQQLKNHNLIGVVQAQERWGPPDPRERHLRHLFNPREETRSRRRNETCKHKCFLRSKVLVQAVDEQERLRVDEDYNLNASEGSDDESDSD